MIRTVLLLLHYYIFFIVFFNFLILFFRYLRTYNYLRLAAFWTVMYIAINNIRLRKVFIRVHPIMRISILGIGIYI
jgi:hypothetical protein